MNHDCDGLRWPYALPIVTTLALIDQRHDIGVDNGGSKARGGTWRRCMYGGPECLRMLRGTYDPTCAGSMFAPYCSDNLTSLTRPDWYCNYRNPSICQFERNIQMDAKARFDVWRPVGWIYLLVTRRRQLSCTYWTGRTKACMRLAPQQEEELRRWSRLDLPVDVRCFDGWKATRSGAHGATMGKSLRPEVTRRPLQQNNKGSVQNQQFVIALDARPSC